MNGVAMTLGALAFREACLLARLWAFSLHKCCSIFLHMPRDMHHATLCLVPCNTMQTQYSEMSYLSLPCLFHLIFTPWKGLALGSRPKRIFLVFYVQVLCPNHRIRFNIQFPQPSLSSQTSPQLEMRRFFL